MTPEEIESIAQQGDALRQRYEDPRFIEESYRIQPLSQLLESAEVIGVSRLIILPSFSPEIVCTLTFSRDHLESEHIAGKTSLWSSFPSVHRWFVNRRRKGKKREHIEISSTPFDPNAAVRLRLQHDLRSSGFPLWMRDWNSCKVYCGCLKPSAAPACDGVRFVHFLADRSEQTTVTWYGVGRGKRPPDDPRLVVTKTLWEISSPAGRMAVVAQPIQTETNP